MTYQRTSASRFPRGLEGGRSKIGEINRISGRRLEAAGSSSTTPECAASAPEGNHHQQGRRGFHPSRVAYAFAVQLDQPVQDSAGRQPGKALPQQSHV